MRAIRQLIRQFTQLIGQRRQLIEQLRQLSGKFRQLIEKLMHLNRQPERPSGRTDTSAMVSREDLELLKQALLEATSLDVDKMDEQQLEALYRHIRE